MLHVLTKVIRYLAFIYPYDNHKYQIVCALFEILTERHGYGMLDPHSRQSITRLQFELRS